MPLSVGRVNLAPLFVLVQHPEQYRVLATRKRADSLWKKVPSRKRPFLSEVLVMTWMRVSFTKTSPLSVRRCRLLKCHINPSTCCPGDIIEVQLPLATTNPHQQTGQ
jgi:hypothetical protein